MTVVVPEVCHAYVVSIRGRADRIAVWRCRVVQFDEHLRAIL